MENRPSLDRELLLPILLGGLSLIGIGVVFVMGRMSDSRQPASLPDTETPFRFVYLGTEPGLSTLTPEATDTSAPAVILSPPAGEDDAVPTDDLAATQPVSQTPTSSSFSSPTSTPTIAAVLGKIDDTNFELLYDGDWVEQSDVTGTYLNTLHISFTLGSSVSFTFTGQQVVVSFQAGPSLGTVSITLDGLQFVVDQSSSTTQLIDWQSAILVRGTHTIVITHQSGGSINLDSITIPAIPTPTPTPTITLTPTPLNN